MRSPKKSIQPKMFSFVFSVNEHNLSVKGHRLGHKEEISGKARFNSAPLTGSLFSFVGFVSKGKIKYLKGDFRR